MGWPVARLIAVKLVSLGVKDEVYFEEVARYAREGIAADPPPAYLPDATGSYDNQVRNPSYEKWCAARNLEWVACTKKYAAMVMDIQFLDGLHDSRAIPVLRRGLAATDSGVVTYSVAGLAMLNDKESFPLITQACARFPQKEAESIVILGAAHFDDPSVLALYDAFIKDPKTREKAKEEWRAQHGHAP